MNRYTAIIMDIDGTLANAEHRIHLLPARRRPEDRTTPDEAWQQFFAAAKDDVVNPEIRELNNAMFKAGYEIAICTGRPERDRQTTIDWLIDNDIRFHRLLMRAHDDHRPDTEVKREMLDEVRREGRNVLFAVEDRKSVVGMWREAGIRCLQVCDGDY